MNPPLLDNAAVLAAFQPDAVERARKYLAAVAPAVGIGAYTDSAGILAVRQEVADFIEARDGHPADPQQIFLTDGASAGVRLMMQIMTRPKPDFNDGLLVPIPQYPLYSALTAVFDGNLVP
jgi:aspartate/methionine/tyrosine aminotransferase